MDEKLQLDIIKIIKKHKQEIVTQMEEKSTSKLSYVNLEDELNNSQEKAKKIIQILQDEIKVFNTQYEHEWQMKSAIEAFFSSLQTQISFILSSFKKIKSSNHNAADKILGIKLIEKILMGYLLWLEKLESAILGVGKSEAILILDVTQEVELIEYVSQHTKHNDSCLFPMLASFGIGFMIGND